MSERSEQACVSKGFMAFGFAASGELLAWLLSYVNYSDDGSPLSAIDTLYSPAQILSIACAFVCGGCLVYTISFLKRNGGKDSENRPIEKLVVHGPYSVSRNPSYVLCVVFCSLFSIAICLIPKTFISEFVIDIFAVVVPALLFLYFDEFVIPEEERKAVTRENRSLYEAYAKRTPRWL